MHCTRHYIALVVLAMSLTLLSTTAIQPTPANAANTNATQQVGAAANQAGEKAQAGAAIVTQEAKSGTNQAGQTRQALMNKTVETLHLLIRQERNCRRLIPSNEKSIN